MHSLIDLGVERSRPAVGVPQWRTGAVPMPNEADRFSAAASGLLVDVARHLASQTEHDLRSICVGRPVWDRYGGLRGDIGWHQLGRVSLRVWPEEIASPHVAIPDTFETQQATGTGLVLAGTVVSQVVRRVGPAANVGDSAYRQYDIRTGPYDEPYLEANEEEPYVTISRSNVVRTKAHQHGLTGHDVGWVQAPLSPETPAVVLQLESLPLRSLPTHLYVPEHISPELADGLLEQLPAKWQEIDAANAILSDALAA